MRDTIFCYNNVLYYNAFLKKFRWGSVAVSEGRFVRAGEPGEWSSRYSEQVDCNGALMIPGLIDIHLHIESSMSTPRFFVKEVGRRGVTTIVADPHEIANVAGLAGIQYLLSDAEDSPAEIFAMVPSSVPASDLETSGAVIGYRQYMELIETNDHILGLGEVMDYRAVARGDDTATVRLLREIKRHQPRAIIEGHSPKLAGVDLDWFMFEGPDSDHTQMTPEGIRERFEQNMFVEIQEKSLTPDIVEVLQDPACDGHFAFVTDDVMADKLMKEGHLDNLFRKAVSLGLSPERVVYAMTAAPANRMRLSDRGVIAPGKRADFVLLTNLEHFEISSVYRGGLPITGDTKGAEGWNRFPPPLNTVYLDLLSEKDLEVPTPVANGPVECRAIMVNGTGTFTEEKTVTARAVDGALNWHETGTLLAAVFNRHGHPERRSFGLVGGAALKRGAIATTYAHDSHNLLVIGATVPEMLLAANAVIANQGGICVVEGGVIKASVALPIAGLLSDQPLSASAQSLREIRSALTELGYDHYEPVMSLATLTLTVSPALKLSDLGLVDVAHREVVSLFL